MKDLKYLEVMEFIRKECVENPAFEGPLPTEMELAKRFGISRFPVNRAVEILVQEGKLVRVDGIGAFIKGKEPKRFKDRLRQRGSILTLISETFAPDPRLLQGADSEARKAGMLLSGIFFDRSKENPRELIKSLKASGASGALLVPCIHFEEGESPSLALAKALEAKGIPTVALDRPLPGFNGGQVVIDNAGGAMKAIQELSRRGCRKIAYFGKDDYIVGRERLMGYRLGLDYCALPHSDALESLLGGKADFIQSLDARAEETAKSFMRHAPDCDAYMAFNSTFAWSLFRSLKKLGGLNAKTLFAGFEPSLQGDQEFRSRYIALERPLEEVGRKAAALLLSKLETPKDSLETIRIIPELSENKPFDDAARALAFA